MEVPTKILVHSAHRWDPTDFEEYLDGSSEESYQSEGKAQWEFSLNPLAEPPAGKFAALLENDPKFKGSWLHTRKMDSQSEYDQSLASLAMAAGWTAQEIVNLLIANRRTHKEDLKLRADYYIRTLNKAVQGLGGDSHGGGGIPEDGVQASTSDKGLIKEIVDTILKDHHFAKDAGGLLYHYEHGSYQPNGQEVITSLFQQILEKENRIKRWTSHRSREVMEFIRVGAPVLWSVPPLNMVNVQNGLLPLGSKPEQKPHSSTHLCSIQLPIVFDPQATCSVWDQFLEEVFPKDTLTLVWELIASLMIPDTSPQKAVLLIGEGANGKSTFLQALKNFLGASNVSSLSLQRLERDKFAVARLVGKLANICADLPSDHLTTSSIFKALTGGDDIEAERKFQNSFTFTPFARLIFSANHYPRSNDSSEAFFRRWIVIPFERIFAPHEQQLRRVLDAKLADPNELSGVLNRALAVLPQFQAQGSYTECESTGAAWKDFRDHTDPIATWLDEHTIDNPESLVARGELHRHYNVWVNTHGRPSISQKAFLQAVRRLRPGTEEKQRVVSGKTQWVFLGLGLKTSQL